EGPLRNATERSVMTTTSASPSARAGPPRQGPSTTSTVGTRPEASARARATEPQPCRPARSVRRSTPAPVTMPTTGRPASMPARIVRRTTSVSTAVAVPWNQATGRSRSRPGTRPSPAPTAPGRPVATGIRGTTTAAIVASPLLSVSAGRRAHDQRHVVAAERERRRQRGCPRDRAGLAGHDVDRQVGPLVVGRRGHEALVGGEQRGDRLDRPGGADHVPGHALARGDGHGL